MILVWVKDFPGFKIMTYFKFFGLGYYPTINQYVLLTQKNAYPAARYQDTQADFG